ncbi:sodium-dependent glucose transporter 1A-like [Ptychodera flava]|uniref:sodium-dependent glucose transporter 1A-like n=1 Tax=Ptychodera flava TaxID=63121 RepID=UPI00396AAC8B
MADDIEEDSSETRREADSTDDEGDSDYSRQLEAFEDHMIHLQEEEDHGEEDDEEYEGTSERVSNRKLKAFSLYLAFFGLGMDIAVVGPSLPDLQLITGQGIDKIAILFSTCGAGYLLGSFLGSACFERLGKAMVALSLLGSGAMSALVPWCDNLASLLFVFAVFGLVDGCLDSGGNNMCAALRSKKYTRALHLTYAVGAILSPLIACPFLSPELVKGTVPPSSNSSTSPPISVTVHPGYLEFPYGDGHVTAGHDISRTSTQANTFQNGRLHSNRTNQNNYNTFFAHDSLPSSISTQNPFRHGQSLATTVHRLKPTHPIEVKNVTILKSTVAVDTEVTKEMAVNRSRLWIPWTIIAIYKVLVACPFFVLFCIGTKRQILQEIKEIPTVEQTEKRGSGKFRWSLLTFLFIFYFLCHGQEGIYGGFLYSYAVRAGLGFTPIIGGVLNSLFWIGFTISRAIGGFFAYHLSQTAMIIVNLSGLCTFSIILAVVGKSSAVPIWICTPFLGFFMAAMFPSGASWAEQYIMLTSKATASFLLAGSLSQIILPLPVGKILFIYDFSVLFYMIVTMAAAAVAVYIVMQTFVSCYYHCELEHKEGQHTMQDSEFIFEEITSDVV